MTFQRAVLVCLVVLFVLYAWHIARECLEAIALRLATVRAWKSAATVTAAAVTVRGVMMAVKTG